MYTRCCRLASTHVHTYDYIYFEFFRRKTVHAVPPSAVNDEADVPFSIDYVVTIRRADGLSQLNVFIFAVRIPLPDLVDGALGMDFRQGRVNLS